MLTNSTLWNEIMEHKQKLDELLPDRDYTPRRHIDGLSGVEEHLALKSLSEGQNEPPRASVVL